MAGYFGYSMSNNAVDAYENGEMPISKWSKKAIMEEVEKSVREGELSLQCSMQALGKLPVKALKEYCLYSSSKHHTSKYYNMTEFYSLDIDRLEGLTDQELVEIVHMYKQQGGQEITEEKWKCSFLEWYGSRNHRKPRRFVETGTVKGQWFIRADGTRKKTTATGFEFIEKIEDKAAVPAKGMEDTPRCRGKEG